MIPVVQLIKSRLKTSRLAFGTSRLHYIDRHRREELLAVAAELGFLHFDTAPAYGDGLAEREIGRFVRGKRSKFIIAAKFGILADPMIPSVPALALPIRGARAIVRRMGFWQSQRPPLTASGLRESTEQSLRRMGTEWVDILLLQEPSPHRLPSAGAILEELGKLRQRGLIRHYGLAGGWGGIAGMGEVASELGEIVQTGESEWPDEFPPDITYGVMSAGPQSVFASSIDPASALERLRSALKRRPRGVVLVATSKPEHLRSLAKVAREDSL